MLAYIEAGNKDEENTYWVCRLMIDKQYQGKGYGKEAVVKAIEHVRTFPHGKASALLLSYEPENVIAKTLYAACGFVETGEIQGGELVAKLPLQGYDNKYLDFKLHVGLKTTL